ncbi:MAG: Crp/Fnr family transcriptional regulator [Paracoccaceae bacterium]|nr:MAG: Crp/Fnr family transcriptional regulator [Paracoccaceae bacterium]
MMGWTAAIGTACADALARLDALTEREFPRGTFLFRPGEAAQGFVVVLAGRVEVNLAGPSGREILLYAVEPGQSCIQSTLGLLGDEPYAGEAVCATEVRAVVIPRALFLTLMERDAAFRLYVLRAFARRMQDMTRLLERVAFGRVECRLADALLSLAEGDIVHATQAELATRIGTAREVVSRGLGALSRAGMVDTVRGAVRLTDAAGLRRLAAAGV